MASYSKFMDLFDKLATAISSVFIFLFSLNFFHYSKLDKSSKFDRFLPGGLCITNEKSHFDINMLMGIILVKNLH